MSWIDKVKFDEKGLVPVVVQDYKSKDVLMVAYANMEALERTLIERKVYYYSRSRQKLWLKGETSGFTQTVKSIYVDCDMDCLLIKVIQKGGACHTGYMSCFYREDAKGILEERGKKVFDPEKVYKKRS